MAVDHQKLAAAYETMFEVELGQAAVEAGLVGLCQAFGAAGSSTFELNRKTGALSNWLTPEIQDGRQEYLEHIHAIDPRVRYSARHAAGHIVYDSLVVDLATINRHEFYDWLRRSMGLRYFIGSRVYDEGETSLLHSLEFDIRHGHPEPEKIDQFRQSSRALGNAWRVANRTDVKLHADGRNGWTPDHLPWAILALDDRGTILQLNARAEALLAAGGPLTIQDGTLQGADRSTAARLAAAIGTAIAGDSAEVLIAAGQASAPLMVQVLPVNPTARAVPMPVAALVYVWNPAQRRDGRQRALARLWGFSAAEVRLLEALSAGVDLAIAAAELGISRNTARNRLQAMFAKTGTRRQTELIVRTMGVLGG